MKITNASPIKSNEVKKRLGAGVRGASFSSFMSGGVEETSATMPLSSVSALNILNEVEDAAESPKKVVEHGNNILDELEKLRDGLLYGGISVSRLERMQQMLQSKLELTQDPKLAEIIEEIEIRAAVELAKLGRYWTYSDVVGLDYKCNTCYTCITMTLSIRLDAETEERLNRLAKYTGRSKSFYVKEALLEKLEDLEDIYVAEMRLLNTSEKTWTLEQVMNEEDLANWFQKQCIKRSS